MKRVLILLVLFLTLSIGFKYLGFKVEAGDESIEPGELVKTESLPNIYYLASDRKLYIFPEPNAYFSWYDEFYNLRIVSDELFAKYQLGGIVYYRPGKYLLKAPTDTRVYAVDPNGVLRWLKNEASAKKFYGDAWQQNIYDLNDTHITSYTKGEDIDIYSEYDRTRNLEEYDNISQNQGLEDIKLSMPRVDQFLAKQGEHPTNFRISPLDVGVFVELGRQDFKAEGYFESSKKWEDITDQVDWRVANHPFKAQTHPASETVWMEQDGVAVLLNSWGRADIKACYPEGCGNGVVTPKFSAKTSLTIITTSDWVNPDCMSNPLAKWYQVTESMTNVKDAGQAVLYNLYPGNTFFSGWGKLWAFYSVDENRTFRSFAWDWTVTRINNLKPTEEGYGQERSWIGTMVSSICDQENCNTNPHTCNGRRRSNIMFIPGGTPEQ